MFNDIRGCRAVFVCVCVSCGLCLKPLDGTGFTLLKNILKVTGGGSYPGSVGGGLLGPVVVPGPSWLELGWRFGSDPAG